MSNIIKRDGRVVAFDQNKIIDAVLAAFKSIDGEVTEYALIKAGNISDYIAEIAEDHDLTVEEVQDYDTGLKKTREEFVSKLNILGIKYTKVSEEYFEELESILIMADIGVNTVNPYIRHD